MRIPRSVKGRWSRADSGSGTELEPQPSAAGATRVRWPSFGPPDYLGQLDADFQRSIGQERGPLTRAECNFYHSAELPDGDVIMGPWDLRGREREYLGGVEVSGRRVLELGPAT